MAYTEICYAIVKSGRKLTEEQKKYLKILEINKNGWNGVDKVKKKMVEIEYEKMVIDIPKGTKGVSITFLIDSNNHLTMDTSLYDTQDIIKRKIEI